MANSNFLPTPDDVDNDKNSAKPEPDKPAPASVQIRKLEDGMVVRNGWVKQRRMKGGENNDWPRWS